MLLLPHHAAEYHVGDLEVYAVHVACAVSRSGPAHSRPGQGRTYGCEFLSLARHQLLARTQ
eukprot:3885511-Heterocapsa_arctica.AAC.1